MENNVLLNEEQQLASDQLVKATALLYLKEALEAQDYETCPELIKTARNLGVKQEEITDVITEHLKAPGRQRRNRVL